MAKRMQYHDAFIETWAEGLFDKGIISKEGLDEDKLIGLSDMVYPHSVSKIGSDTLALAKMEDRRMLLVIGPNFCGFKGKKVNMKGTDMHFCLLTHTNAEVLRKHFPYTAPSVLSESGTKITIGLGDRLGALDKSRITNNVKIGTDIHFAHLL